jgi:NAD(P)-dependent dehydrogenase (short-subunit alcohol dehydrogenase family)
VRPLDESTVIITGATSGLGRYLAAQLAASGAHVVVHGRSAERVEETRAEILASTGDARVSTVIAELGSLASVDHLAAEIETRFERVDVLVNNAGIGFGAPGSGHAESTDGIELRFAVNYLAGYHLTRRLIPLLTASAPARVVNVSSIGQYPIDFDDPMLERGYSGVNAYRQSKLAQVMFTIDLAEELRGAGVTVNALHPATLMDTPMVREADYETRSTVEEGGTATLRLIADPKLDGTTGTYSNGLHEAKANDQAYDPGARARLRELSDELIGRVLG